MNENLVYWVWVTLCFPPGSRKMQLTLEQLSPRELYERRENPGISCLAAADLMRLRAVSLEQAEMVRQECQRLGVQILTMEDEKYPKRLLGVDAPPPVLYYQGSLAHLDESLTIGIVGTRKAKEYYLRATGNISYELARAGAVIISGCAVGCDEYAHKGALKAGGRTVGVLACGFGVNYPRDTEGVRQAMLQNGALVSELPPGTKDDRHYFHIRNRLIAGLSEGVLVTQVPLRSGALLTADHAVEQGKDLFCLPPDNIFDGTCMGAADLIRDCARVVFSAWDILEEYLERFGAVLDAEKLPPQDMTLKSRGEKRPSDQASGPPAEEKPPLTLPDDLSAEQKAVLAMLENGPAHVESLLAQMDAAPYELLATLTELELRGLVTAQSGQRYERVGEK